MKYKRIFLIVIDSVGVGALPDAKAYGDQGANTIGNLAKAAGGIALPTLGAFGFGNLTEIIGVPPVERPLANTTKLAELSNGKDTMTGHWEMMGIKTVKPFKTFTDKGFPKALLDELEKASNRKIIGNVAASGTEIIATLGAEHCRTGALIVYTSADSVLQIAAHEEVVPLVELYDICKKARQITMRDEWKVGRIIARPFLGSEKTGFKRTTNRHDYALSPPEDTVLNYLERDKYDVISVGKIRDIFNNSGITDHHPIISNHDGMMKTMALAESEFTGLTFVNLVDFDALYGHRRDVKGYKHALEEFDSDLGELCKKITSDDLLMITADHGNDPTYSGTDHTREYVPLFIFNPDLQGQFMAPGETFANIGATIAENFNVSQTDIGISLLKDLR
ncbi:MAG: phosphopentomutase [Candidatus Izemoplasmatales bacterium]|jgi:phosphopentomutase